ncbi:hypothetical protein [Fimbriiglobus ruber]|uniref:Uncharacterized protein n=1 Tax=Fimbriiglobus ruber TaxID=1908690 RepID=A0A225DT48_9BACT|nr:hypothetical protein [Fimbriiglobus ruber]OWK40349.1 hypothetical protein FRUB_05268 [Fimbriiglobus ruber]
MQVEMSGGHSVPVVIFFCDDRGEKWTVVDAQMVVEHWFPAAQYPTGPKVLGIETLQR